MFLKFFALYNTSLNGFQIDVYIYIYIKQVKQERRLTPSKDDHKMLCILEALQVQIYKSKR